MSESPSNSTSTSSNDSDDTDNDDSQQLTPEDIHEFLTDGHYGKDNAITVSEIADRLDAHDEDITNYKTRRMVKATIEETYLPVGSCRDGYYVMAHPDEFEATIDDLRNRIAGMEQRMHLLARAWNVHRRRVDRDLPEDSQ